jgi:DNA topoisomerase-1
MEIEDRGWWRRVGAKETGFRYLKVDGRRLMREASLRRIASLAIPPAWTDVHIAPVASWKVQAWGVDQAGRRQYIYSPEHVASRDGRKWRRVGEVARLLPRLREVTNRHLRGAPLGREQVLATVVRLIARAYFRAGSERYAVANRTFGICTLTKRHVRVDGRNLIFSYVGKHSKDQRQVVAETPLVRIIGALMALPGERLFQFRNGEGVLHGVTARSVNRYLREILGRRVTSKDLRTFGGTLRAATVLSDLGPARSSREAKKNVLLACRLVSLDLGNTPAICRAAYIHPAVLERYQSGGLTIEPLMRRQPRAVRAEEPVSYYPEEAALMRFLERYG